MANAEQLAILKQGVEAWNAWRKKHPEIEPDFTEADLTGADISGAFLTGARLDGTVLNDAILDGVHLDCAVLTDARLDRAMLTGARLDRANLEGAHLNHAILTAAILDDGRLERANLLGANLLGASLRRAILDDAILTGATLEGAVLEGARLHRAVFDDAILIRASLLEARLVDASLLGANLLGASLFDASLVNVSLDGAHLVGAKLGWTVVVNVDLSQSEGLETVVHDGPSGIATSTLGRTAAGLAKDGSQQGEFEAFLRGCGLSDWEIESAKLHAPGLSNKELTDIIYEIHRLKGESPIQINPLFISYSHFDMPFVETLEKLFDERRMRYWRDVHDMKAGRMETQIERAIRHNPIVLLVLSEASVESDWVEWEVSKAREIEKREKRDVLCPVALDDAWKTCRWPGPLRRQIEDYNILDFSEWRDDAAMERQFQKLIDGLGMFYPKNR